MCLLLVGTMPYCLPARPTTDVTICAPTAELPWATVDAVLKKVAAQGRYAYADLVAGYDAGSVMVAQSGSGYLVTIARADGLLDVIIIDMH